MKSLVFKTLLLVSFLLLPLASRGEVGDTLTGYFIEQPGNTFLHVYTNGVWIEFAMLDENYHQIENEFTRGVITVNKKGKSKERMVVRPTGDGMTLKSSKTIRKPHLFKINGRLYKGEEDTIGESLVLQYNQHLLEEVTVKPLPVK